MRSLCIFLPLILAGCTTPPAPTPTPVARVVPVTSPTKLVETRYEVRGYREPAHPAVRHEAHTVFRRTRVPVTAGDEPVTVSRATYPPISFTPLPASDELGAELATQKKITADLRAIQASMVETEQRAQAQYAQLVRQSAEVQKLHGQLEAERARVRSATQTDSPVPAPTGATVANSTEAKW